MRIKFAFKLYIPIVIISIIVGVFAYNMKDISRFVDSELKVASKKELALQADTKFIQNSLKSMKTELVEDILDKKPIKKTLKKLSSDFQKVKEKLEKIKKSPHFQTKERKQLLKNLSTRIDGYYLILKDIPLDFQESFEDGTYSMLSLTSISKKLDDELSKLQKTTKDILNDQVYKLVSKKIEFYVIILGISLFILFILTYILDKKILNSVAKLKELNHSFLLFVQQKIDRVEKIDISNVTNDEIGDVIKKVSDNINYVEGIIKEDRELKVEIEETQKEIIFTMGAIGESRSKETGNHVKRVAEYSYLLAKLYGLSEEESTLIKEASPMHDIGKVAIPDSILKKPGKLTDEEFKVMKTHSKLGYEMLKHSQRSILKAASIIAYEHHEKYNGTGYPRGLKGEEIHIYGAITAIADVFDALGSDRCYKKAWDDEKIINLFIEETGEHFHPVLANLFLKNFKNFVKIREKFRDCYIGEKELI